MKKNSRPLLLRCCILLYAAGIAFCIAAFLGHAAAWSAAAVCLLAATATVGG